jgi:hypothetical protein
MQTVLSEHTQGWLRFIWEKSTTADDWSSSGTPHAWWDRTSTAPMCSFPRFDLGETSYILPVLADQTPAWREVYTRIADELVGRHTTFWAAIDWLTLIGPDRRSGEYPPEWQAFVPPHLQGRYELPGWTANGVEPWGLQPDPIGADGNLFFRGFFNLLLSIYRYVSGDTKWESPFEVTGYRDTQYRWSHREIAEFLHQQWQENPQGPHCENTKIWPFCLSAAGLGLQMYDQTAGAEFHGVFDEWVAYARKHFLRTDRRGRLEEFPFYYDPLRESLFTFPGSATAFAAISITPYLLPQNPEFAEYLYREATRKLGWSNANKAIVAVPDPRFQIVGLLVAQELGDDVTAKRLRDSINETSEPRAFGGSGENFGYWFGTGEDYPRGQLSALMMLCEAGQPGAWTKAFNNPTYKDRFLQPTVVGVDYPNLGISEAWNNIETGELKISSYAATPSMRGTPSAFKVNNLPNVGLIKVLVNDQDYPRWHALNEHEIEIQIDTDTHSITVLCGRPGTQRDPAQTEVVDKSPSRPAESNSKPRTYPPVVKNCTVGCC